MHEGVRPTVVLLGREIAVGELETLRGKGVFGLVARAPRAREITPARREAVDDLSEARIACSIRDRESRTWLEPAPLKTGFKPRSPG